jgi:hypothetical protein
MKFESRSFNIVYSNSVVEHLGSWEEHIAFASEYDRVGQKFWLQAYAKCFPVEPHLNTPFIHLLPIKMQSLFIGNFSILGIITKPTQKFIDGFLQERGLLLFRKMNILFPDCKIIKDVFFYYGTNRS